MHRSPPVDDAGHYGCRSRAMLFVLDRVILMTINYNLFHSGVFILVTFDSILIIRADQAGDGSNRCRGPAGRFERLNLQLVERLVDN